jgi:hypothetical protein
LALNQGSFPPPALPGFTGTTSPSATSWRPGHPSRASGWTLPCPRHEASRVAAVFLFHACRRHYPGGSTGCVFRSLHQCRQPSPFIGWVGFRITRFGACSAFTRVAACMLARSLNDPLHRRLQPLHHFHDCSDCYRPERRLPGGIRTH